MKRKFTIIEKIICLALIALIVYIPLHRPLTAWALEFQRDKNVATYILAPLVNSTTNTTFSSGANNTAFYITYQDNNGLFGNLTQAASNISKIGNANLFNWPLNQSEMNHDVIVAFYNASGSMEQIFEINTALKEAIDTASALASAANETVNSATIGNSVIEGYVDDLETRLTAARAGYLDKLNVTGTLAHSDNATLYKADVSNLDAAVSTRLASASYTAPDNAGIAAANATINHATHGNEQLLTAINTRGTSNLTAADLAALDNVTLAGTQAFNMTGNIAGNVTSVTNPVTITAASIQGIWDALTSALSTVGSIGKLLVDNINASIGSRMATFTLPGNFSAMNITADGNVTTGASGGLTAAQVFDYDISGYVDAGKAGTYLKGAGSAGDPWSTPIPGAYGAGTAGYIVGNNLNASVSSRSSHSAADVAALILATPANKLVTNGSGYVTTTHSFPANFSLLSIDANGRIDLSKVNGSAINSLISGRIDANAQAMANNVITSSVIAAGAITSSQAPNLDAAVSTRSSHSAADTWTVGSRTLTAGTNIILAKGVGITGFNDISAQNVWEYVTRTIASVSGNVGGISGITFPSNFSAFLISAAGKVTVGTNDDKLGYGLSDAAVDSIWNELQSGHTTAGTFGKYLDAQVSAVGGGSLTEGGIADAVLNELLAGHTTSGSLGKAIADIETYTNGVKDSGDYNGIEKTIRQQR